MHQRQATLDDLIQQGTAILKIRESVKSDEKFGKILKQNNVGGSQQTRNSLIHLAKFFDGRDTSKIPIRCAREISKPMYSHIAEEAYLQVLEKDFSLKDVKILLDGLLNKYNLKNGLDVIHKKAVIPEKFPTKFKFDKNKLTTVETEQLAIFYRQVDLQAPLVKGLILLELRKRFPSNLEFNKAVKQHGLNIDIQQKRNLFMNLASFFEDRSMEGISLTVAYEISSPDNKHIAESLYEEAVGKNLSVKQIKQLIREQKGILVDDEAIVGDGNTPKQKIEINKTLVNDFISLAKQDYSSQEELIAFFKSCLESVKKNSKDNTIEGEAIEILSTDLSVDRHG